jgi:hypothetical protein
MEERDELIWNNLDNLRRSVVDFQQRINDLEANIERFNSASMSMLSTCRNELYGFKDDIAYLQGLGRGILQRLEAIEQRIIKLESASGSYY